MRIAVCVSGQMRAFEAVAPSLLEHIVRPYGADVFVHTWSNRGLSSNAHNRMLPPPMSFYLKAQGDLDGFRQVLPRTTENLFTSRDTVTEDEIRLAYGADTTVVIEDYPDDEPAFFGAQTPARLLEVDRKAKWSLPLFYKIDACNRLKSAREHAEGFTYDVVIRIRPDLTVGSDFTAGRTGTQGILHHRIHTQNTNWQVGDQLFLGDSASMDEVTALFRHIPDIYAGIPAHLPDTQVRKYWAEGLLHTHVTERTGVVPRAFRTEPFLESPRSGYLLYTSEERIGFEEFFWSFREDALAAPDPGALDTVRRGCSRALYHFTQPLAAEKLDRARELADVAERDGLFDVRLTRGMLAYKDRDYAAAESLFQELADEEPAVSIHLLWLGRSKFALDKPDEALTALDLAIAAPLEYRAQNPAQRSPVFYWRGRVLESQKRWAEAAESYDIANALTPRKFGTLLRLGRAQHAAGNHHRAMMTLLDARALSPGHRDARYLLADSMVRIGVYKPVLSDLWIGTVDETAGDHPRVLPVVAEAYLGLRDRSAARECLEAYLADPDRLAKAGRRVVDIAERISPEYGAVVRSRIAATRTAPADVRPAEARRVPAVARHGVRLLRRAARRLRRAS